MKHFLHYFENVTEPSLEKAQKARALIEYLLGKVFDFFYEWCAEVGELSEERQSYTNVKNILRKQFGRKKHPARLIERTLSLKIRSKQSVEKFVEVATKTFSEAGFADKQKFVFFMKVCTRVSRRSKYFHSVCTE